MTNKTIRRGWWVRQTSPSSHGCSTAMSLFILLIINVYTRHNRPTLSDPRVCARDKLRDLPQLIDCHGWHQRKSKPAINNSETATTQSRIQNLKINKFFNTWALYFIITSVHERKQKITLKLIFRVEEGRNFLGYHIVCDITSKYVKTPRS